MDVNRAQCITTKEYFSRLYDDICHNLQQTTDDISKLHVDNEDGKKQLNVMMEQLQTLQNNFNHKLNYLKQHAEWDRFTVAFLGETNAGKSTIIESLRIFLMNSLANSFYKIIRMICNRRSRCCAKTWKCYVVI